MITPSDIVNHLAEYLPRVSDKFSDSIGVSSATVGNDRTITVNTTAVHGLNAADPLLFVGGQTSISISAVSEFAEDVSALIEFDTVHDFTDPNSTILTEPLPCTGFNESVWNTTLSIIAVPTDQSVVVSFPAGAAGIPTFTTAVGYEERPLSIFGTQAVATAPTTTQFTVELSTDVPTLPDGVIINLSVATGARIAAADTIKRAEAIYSEAPDNDDLWAFVIMLDADVSKDRHTRNDSIGSFTNQNEMRLKVLNNFSIVVFFRTAANISGATAQELAYGEVYTDLLRVLYGFGGFAKDEDNSQYVSVTAGHGPGTSNTSYYTHGYDWQLPVDLTIDNGFMFYKDVALRNLNMNLPMFTTDNEEKLTIAINITAPYIFPAYVSQVYSLEHDTLNGTHNSLVQIDSEHYILAYAGNNNRGYIKTFSVDGSYVISQIDLLEHDSVQSTYNSLVKIDDTHFILAYLTSTGGYIKTFEIDGAYGITEIDSFQHTSNATYNSLVKIDDTHFILAYTGDGADGFIKTFVIDGSYNISQIYSLEHDTGSSSYGSLAEIDSTHFILASSGGNIKTFSIDGSYIISEIHSLDHDTTSNHNSLVKIDETHFILAYAGVDADGYIKTFGIDGAYNISALHVIEHDIYNGEYNSLVQSSLTNYILAYQGRSDDGFIKTLEIDGSYNIVEIDALEHDLIDAEYNSLVKIDLSHYILAYAGDSGDGYIKTFNLGLE